MRRDYENIDDIGNLDDDDLREVVIERLRERPEIDPDDFDVEVAGGKVRVSGRVGTEEEVQEVDQVLGDLLGVATYSNDLIVDETRRAERAEAADDARVEDDAVEDELGESGNLTESSAEHLLGDEEGELYGTQDMQRAIERGEAYTPPDRPPQLGTESRENH
ncbi:MAG: BON domain-containing protein [Longimicrobiales bacterium]